MLSMSSAVAAVTPTVLQDFYLARISPDGRYIISQTNGSMQIHDQQTGTDYTYIGGDMDEQGRFLDYSLGHGRSCSSTGVIVGATAVDGTPSYWKDGEWHTVAGLEQYPSVYFNDITDDGKMIVGDLSNLANESEYDGTMLVPAIWEDINGDGSYSKMTMLPRPTLDWFNQAPQYITAIGVDYAGNVIAGQIVDCNGFYIYPIVWTKNDSGEWAFSYPTQNLFNPSGIEIPAAPGDSPNQPQPQDYMTEEEAAAYQAAMDEWMNNGWQGDAPNPANYMTAEEIAAYNAAVDSYNAAAEAWQTAYDSFYGAVEQIIAESPNFVFNDIVFAPNGKTMYSTVEKAGASFWDPSETGAFQYNFTDGSHVQLPMSTNGISVTQAFDDGTVIGNTPVGFMSYMPSQAYIKLPTDTDFQLYYDYLKTANPEIAEYMTANMAHDVETVDEDYNPMVIEGLVCTGFPYASNDLSTLAFGNMNMFWIDEHEYTTTVFTGIESGIKDIAASKNSLAVKAQKGGIFTIAGQAAAIAVYDMSGRQVYAAANPGSVISTGLNSGVYIAKVTDVKGADTIVKVMF